MRMKCIALESHRSCCIAVRRRHRSLTFSIAHCYRGCYRGCFRLSLSCHRRRIVYPPHRSQTLGERPCKGSGRLCIPSASQGRLHWRVPTYLRCYDSTSLCTTRTESCMMDLTIIAFQLPVYKRAQLIAMAKGAHVFLGAGTAARSSILARTSEATPTTSSTWVTISRSTHGRLATALDG